MSKNLMIYRNDWRITAEGDLVCENYYITRERLDEQDWLSHMYEKNWVDKDKFRIAYKAACLAAGIKRVPKGYEGEMIDVYDL